ncbi:ankyrin repeat domain-containing protein [Lentibacter algarum]|uniref:ankyrin repeat domain-containing protein n=1 Tax=Lentibacter algarum TaxID=576131 RepID=UPI001C067E77|nr:ankyrin repeat domain-containing protein [Lentibacter algarum]MBU2980232.1 ankyrin repeat domain-containing protein [Lentibacter algarum]
MLRIFALTLFLLLPHFLVAQVVTPDAEKARGAAITDDVQALKSMTLDKVDVTSFRFESRPLLSYAAGYGSEEATRYLLEIGADINALDADGYTAVMRALEAGYTEIAKFLSTKGADLTSIANDGHTVRTLAEQAGLEGFGPEPTNTPILVLTLSEANQIALAAAEAGDLIAYKFAFENGADKAVKAKNGWSALMLAALGGKADIVDYIIDQGHGPSAPASSVYRVDGVTAIHAALVKTNGKTGDTVAQILTRLKQTKPFTQEFQNTEFRTIVDRSKFSPVSKAKIGAFFPYAKLPPLDYALPTNTPETLEGWKTVQRVLAAKGLYKGSVDGKPGPNTYRALLAYIEPLAQDILERTETASTRSFETLGQAKTNKSGYAFLGYHDATSFSGQLGEFSPALGKQFGYYLAVNGNLVSGQVTKGGYLFYTYERDGIKAQLHFGDPNDTENAQSGSVSFYVNLFDKRISVFFYKDKTTFCPPDFKNCIDSSLVRDFSKYNDRQAMFAALKKRKKEQTEAEAIRKRDAAVARGKEADKRAKERELARRPQLQGGDVLLSEQQFQDFLVDRVQVFSDRYKVQFTKRMTFTFWESDGTISNKGTYTIQPNGHICTKRENKKPFCHAWVVNNDRVVMIVQSKRYALKKSASILQQEADDRAKQLAAKTDDSGKDIADGLLTHDQFQNLIVDRKIRTSTGLEFLATRDGIYSEWVMGNRSTSVKYTFKGGYLSYRNKAGKLRVKKLVYSDGKLFLVTRDVRVRIFVDQ